MTYLVYDIRNFKTNRTIYESILCENFGQAEIYDVCILEKNNNLYEF